MKQVNVDRFCGLHNAAAHSLYALSQCAYGLLYVVMKLTLQQDALFQQPFVFAGLRLALALAAIAPVAVARDRCRTARSAAPSRPRRALLMLGICALCAGATQLLVVAGVARAGASFPALLQPVVPVLCAVFELVARTTRCAAHRVLGLALAIAGVLVLVRVDRVDLRSDETVGILLCVAAIVCVAVGIMAQRAALDSGVPPLTACALTFLGAALLVGPACGWHVVDVDFAALSWQVWLGLLYSGVVANAATEAAAFWCLQRLTPATASMYIVLQPVSSAVLAYFILHEPFLWNKWVGGALTLAGLAAVLLGNERERRAAAAYVPINRADE
jgi:drug/metabolite transporter (DMT)-like permease